MQDFIAGEERLLLGRHGLDRFEALWTPGLAAVEAPEPGQGGWSSVSWLQLDERPYCLKRQRSHTVRSLRHPLGEPALVRELRHIQRCQALKIPVLPAVFCAGRRIDGASCAVLLLRGEAGWRPLGDWLAARDSLDGGERRAILRACGELLQRLHGARLVHGRLSAARILLGRHDQGFAARLDGLDALRPLWRPVQDRLDDLTALLRDDATAWEAREIRQLLGFYLDEFERVDQWEARLARSLDRTIR